MAQQGMPTSGSGLITDVDSARGRAEHWFSPVVKPSGGGGGMGMQVVEHMADLETALVQAQAVANAAFANGGLYLDAGSKSLAISSTRFWLTNRETRCTCLSGKLVQRRHQKLIEESPARALICCASKLRGADICKQLAYNNLGTMETLYSDGKSGFGNEYPYSGGTQCDEVTVSISCSSRFCLRWRQTAATTPVDEGPRHRGAPLCRGRAKLCPRQVCCEI